MLRSGTVLEGRYRIGKKIGEGGSGAGETMEEESECNNGAGSRRVPKPGDGGGEGETMEEESMSV